jgi:ribose transport system permease protein
MSSYNGQPEVEMSDLSVSSDSSGEIASRYQLLWDKLVAFLLEYGAYVMFLLVVVYFGVRSPVFRTPDNVMRIMQQASVLATVSFGFTAVVMGGGDDILKGGIDLSVASGIGLVSGIYAIRLANGDPLLVALVIGLLSALALGLVNGIAVVHLRILPWLVTLATYNIANGLDLIVTNNKNVAVDNAVVRGVADNDFLGFPYVLLIMLAMFIFFYVLMHRSRIGIHIQATGGNPDAALRSGIPVKRLTLLTYLLSGFAVSVGAFLLMTRLSGSTRGVGSLMMLDILLAGYMSAMFSRRSTVNIPGTLIGALFVGTLTNGFTMINVPTYWVQGIKGGLILLIVSVTSIQQKRRENE